MIAYLRGEILEIGVDSVVVDVGGVGYEMLCPASVLAEAAERRGRVAEFFVSTQVREDAITLFGFSEAAQKELFLSLLKVNGVGPKMALNILSGTSRRELVRLIENDDAKGLAKLPKVGKKTAEQIILTLKGKLVHAEKESADLPPLREGVNEVLSALVNLGFRSADVEKVVREMPKETSFDEGIRWGLSRLTSVGRD